MIFQRIAFAAILAGAPAWTAAQGARAAEPAKTMRTLTESDGAACEGPAVVRVKVTNIKRSRGFIVADLHDDVAKDFLKPDRVIHRVRAPAQAGATEFCVPAGAPGSYAIGVYHDKNGNGEFDKGFLRIPKERFGASNNPDFGLSAPDHAECAFDVPEEGRVIEIRLLKASDVLG